MSKTIEVVSRTKGTVSLAVKGESRSITFEDKGDVGIAMCDHDEAAVLLRVPGYWKAGVTGDAVADALTNDPVAAAAAAKLLGGGEKEDDDDDGKQTIKEVAELIKACATIEEVDALVAEDKRIGVLKAAAARRKELAE